MARNRRVPGERPLFWIGSSKDDLLEFPAAVKDQVEDHRGNTFRAVYTVRFEATVYVLHAFQKKSPKGIKTAQTDVELIGRRLKSARKDYEAHYGKGEK